MQAPRMLLPITSRLSRLAVSGRRRPTLLPRSTSHLLFLILIARYFFRWSGDPPSISFPLPSQGAGPDCDNEDRRDSALSVVGKPAPAKAQEVSTSPSPRLLIATEEAPRLHGLLSKVLGCCHGELDRIYDTVRRAIPSRRVTSPG